MALSIETWPVSWPMWEPFAISRGSQTEQETLQVKIIDDDGRVGRGEACGIPYAGDTPKVLAEQIASVADAIERGGIDRKALLKILPSGGARHALDAALWDLESKKTGFSPFSIAGVHPGPVTTACTIGIRTLAQYEASAANLRGYALLKVKVDAIDPIGAINAVRRGNPSSRLIVDPNQSWSIAQLKEIAHELAALGVVLIEQPIPVGAEADLEGWSSPVPLCADELVECEEDLAKVQGRFTFVNIKLDKAGGLTAALRLADAAEARGLGLMVGCMAGSSLSMAPAMVLAQRCAFVDLDGPLLQSEDIENGFRYEQGVVVRPYKPELWG